MLLINACSYCSSFQNEGSISRTTKIHIAKVYKKICAISKNKSLGILFLIWLSMIFFMGCQFGINLYHRIFSWNNNKATDEFKELGGGSEHIFLFIFMGGLRQNTLASWNARAGTLKEYTWIVNLALSCCHPRSLLGWGSSRGEREQSCKY